MPDRMLDSILCLITVTRCPGRRLITRRCGTLAEERLDLVKQWMDEANKDVTPYTVTAGSCYLATWQCGCSCKHCNAAHPPWQASVQKRAAGNNCPYCSGYKVCVCQSLAALYPDLLKELNPESILELDPASVGPSSDKSASWVCAMHGSWVSQISQRTRVSGSGCPSCAHSAKRCVSRPERGFVKDECPEIFAQLHRTLNGDLKGLDRISCGSKAEVWWLCKQDKNRPPGCQHEHAWQARVAHRCSKRKPTGCPFCAGTQVCQCNSISKLKPEVMPFWDCSRNSPMNPENLGLWSKHKAWWHHVCSTTNEEHVWQSPIRNFVSRFSRCSGTLCPICHGKAHKSMIHMGRITKIKK